jgi:hypothetical protein
MSENRHQPGIDQTRWFARIAAAFRWLWEMVTPLRTGPLRLSEEHTTAAPRFPVDKREDPNVAPSPENDGAAHDQVQRPDADQSCEPDHANIRHSNEIIEEPPPAPPSVPPEVEEISEKESDSEAEAADGGAFTTTEVDHRDGGEDHQDLESEASEYEQTDSRCKEADDESDQSAPDEEGEADSQEPRATDVAGPHSRRSRGERKIKPEKRGGRRRGSPIEGRTGPDWQGQPDGRPRKQRPELVCWFQGMARGWTIAVEVPDELQLPSLQVRQPIDTTLEKERSRGGRWCLKHPLESVKFVAADLDEKSGVPLEIPAARYRIFRIVGVHGDRGRAVRQGTTGHFLVVVPESWQWNEELSGPSSAASEFVSPGTCRAHHVELPLEAGRTLAFTTPGGDCVRVPCADGRFELVGERVDDASEEAGPLFVREPPQLRCVRPGEEIAVVVVKEEGLADGGLRWRDHGKQFEDLRLAIANREAGWFSVLLYDASLGPPVESLDFRFVADLEAIEVQSASSAPGPAGHSAARIQFRHGRECSVRCCSAHPLAIESVPNGSIAIVPPDAQFDATRWLIGPIGGRAVEVAVLIERVWWARTSGDTPDERAWTDQPLELSRDDFKATSSTAIVLRLPRAGWADEARLGFEAGRSRSIHLSASAQECVIPLRELGESREIEERSATCLKTWLTRAGHEGESLEAVVGRLPGQLAEDAGFLRSVDKVSARSVMAVLARVRPACRDPLRRIVHDLQMGRYNRIPKHQRGHAHETFARDGLCVLALAVEELEGSGLWRVKLPDGWVRRARAAQAHFPEAMSAIRSRHRELEQEFAVRHGFRGRTK